MTAAALVGAGFGLAGCGEDNTNDAQAAIGNAQTADPSATVDRPGTQSDPVVTGARPSTTAPELPADA